MNAGKTAFEIFNLVWRFDFGAPGFYLTDFGAAVDSRTLRFAMVSLKAQISETLARTGKQFVYRSMGRFDQQVTTRFHLDGAPPESMLMLGYEPSNVRSRLFIADYTRCAFDLGLTPGQFMDDLNPMFHRGEDALSGYITELPLPEEGHSGILLINNSLLPYTDARTNPLGVMHKAEIINPNEKERRVVNSIMLATADISVPDRIGQQQESVFVSTDKISPSIYDGKAE